MQEIRCPNCGEVFQVDESGYAQIAQQVRDKEFRQELERRTKELEESQQDRLKAAQAIQEKAHSEALYQKDAQLTEMEKSIERLQAELSEKETAAKLAVSEAVHQKEKENDAALRRKDDALTEKEREIDRLKALLDKSNTEQALAVSRMEQQKEQELAEKQEKILQLAGKLTAQEKETQLLEKSLKEQYEDRLKIKDEQIEYYKDFKARQSTKMIGESLEQHCLTEFNKIRMAAFPTAYFEKDNDARTGSKGDFIFRECGADGTEFLSIMFEMKNEADTTTTRHKNEDFFKELDKDRREKRCEYAVLVSLLEIDNDYYNSGIVDVSYRYEKMYVIRPQFFIPIITLLRNAVLHSLQYRQELQRVRNQQLDIQNFEQNMQEFKEKFGKNYRIASERFHTAIEEIDKSISHLQKIKDALLSSENNLRLANNKAEELSIKRLTKNAPSVKAMFDAQKEQEP